MTGRRLMVAAGAVGVVAAVGLAVRPLLPVGEPRVTRAAANVSRPVPGPLVRLAVATAAADLACGPGPARAGRDCGRLTVADTAGYYTSAATAEVRLVGSLTRDGAAAIPVALRVRLTCERGVWSAAVVAP